MQVSHSFSATSAVFDDEHLVSYAGLVPVMTLAEQTGLLRLLGEKVHIAEPRIKSAAANPAPKLATVVAGMCVGADSFDDIDVVRCGGMKTLFDGVYAPSTVGTLLREFTFGHARQLESVLREHLVALCARVDLLPGAGQEVFIDIDSLLRPVYGHAKQGASYGHTKIAGKQVLRKGLSPLATTISTASSAPVIAGLRLRAGRANSGKGAGRMVAQAINTARAAGASAQILVRGDSAYGNRAVVAACARHGAHFSLVMTRNGIVTLTRCRSGTSSSGASKTERGGVVHDSGRDRRRCGPGDLVPSREAAGHHLLVLGCRQPVPAWPEVRRDRVERGEEPLRPPDRCEPPHRALPRSGGLVGLLGPIVQVLRAAVLDRGHDLAVRDGVAGQLIGHDHPGHVAQSLQELAEELRGGLRVSTRLDQDVEHGAVLVHRPPQVPQPAVDPSPGRGDAYAAWRRRAVPTWPTSAGSSPRTPPRRGPASSPRPRGS